MNKFHWILSLERRHLHSGLYENHGFPVPFSFQLSYLGKRSVNIPAPIGLFIYSFFLWSGLIHERASPFLQVSSHNQRTKSFTPLDLFPSSGPTWHLSQARRKVSCFEQKARPLSWLSMQGFWCFTSHLNKEFFPAFSALEKEGWPTKQFSWAHWLTGKSDWTRSFEALCSLPDTQFGKKGSKSEVGRGPKRGRSMKKTNRRSSMNRKVQNISKAYRRSRKAMPKRRYISILREAPVFASAAPHGNWLTQGW